MSGDDAKPSHLTMGPDHGAQQLPGSAPAVHAHHAQDLEEAKTSQSGRGKHLTAAAQAEDHDARAYHNHI